MNTIIITKKTICSIQLFLFCALLSFVSKQSVFAQTTFPDNIAGLTFEKKEHNFGKFSLKDGKKTCSFKYKNETKEPILINHVLSSCGCTQPTWSKKPIMPGESGEIQATFLNDQGPFPFEKSLTVYTSASNKPVILRLRGIVTGNKNN